MLPLSDNIFYIYRIMLFIYYTYYTYYILTILLSLRSLFQTTLYAAYNLCSGYPALSPTILAKNKKSQWLELLTYVFISFQKNLIYLFVSACLAMVAIPQQSPLSFPQYPLAPIPPLPLVLLVVIQNLLVPLL